MPINPIEQIPQQGTQKVSVPTVPSPGVSVVGAIPSVEVFNTAPPVVTFLPLPVVDLPNGPIPVYEPLDVNPSQIPGIPKTGASKKEEEEKSTERDRSLDLNSILRAAETARGEAPTTTDAQVVPPTKIADLTIKNEIQVPFVGSIPVPTGKEVTLAGTTAVAATGAALIGKSAVEYLLKVMKPVAQRMWLQVKKTILNQDFSEYEIQMYFAFEKQAEMKKVVKRLRKEEQKERLRQHLEHLQQRHLHIPWRKEKQDERTHQLSLLHRTSKDGPARSQDELYPPQPSDG